jgi:hypothetical protein
LCEGKTSPEEKVMAKNTVTREDARGNKIEVEVGIDGKNPVSPNNPVSEKALLETPTWDYTPGEEPDDAAEESDSDEKTAAKKTAAKKSSSSRKK